MCTICFYFTLKSIVFGSTRKISVFEYELSKKRTHAKKRVVKIIIIFAIDPMKKKIDIPYEVGKHHP